VKPNIISISKISQCTHACEKTKEKNVIKIVTSINRNRLQRIGFLRADLALDRCHSLVCVAAVWRLRSFHTSWLRGHCTVKSSWSNHGVQEASTGERDSEFSNWPERSIAFIGIILACSSRLTIFFWQSLIVFRFQFGLRMAKVVKIDDSDATVQRARSLLNTLDSYRGRLAVAVKSLSIELLQQSLAEATEIGIALEAELEARCVLINL
jgi:hypothetical protein